MLRADGGSEDFILILLWDDADSRFIGFVEY